MNKQTNKKAEKLAVALTWKLYEHNIGYVSLSKPPSSHFSGYQIFHARHFHTNINIYLKLYLDTWPQSKLQSMQLAKRTLIWETGDLDSSFDPIIKTKQTYELEQVT